MALFFQTEDSSYYSAISGEMPHLTERRPSCTPKVLPLSSMFLGSN